MLGRGLRQVNLAESRCGAGAPPAAFDSSLASLKPGRGRAGTPRGDHLELKQNATRLSLEKMCLAARSGRSRAGRPRHTNLLSAMQTCLDPLHRAARVQAF